MLKFRLKISTFIRHCVAVLLNPGASQPTRLISNFRVFCIFRDFRTGLDTGFDAINQLRGGHTFGIRQPAFQGTDKGICKEADLEIHILRLLENFPHSRLHKRFQTLAIMVDKTVLPANFQRFPVEISVFVKALAKRLQKRPGKIVVFLSAFQNFRKILVENPVVI